LHQAQTLNKNAPHFGGLPGSGEPQPPVTKHQADKDLSQGLLSDFLSWMLIWQEGEEEESGLEEKTKEKTRLSGRPIVMFTNIGSLIVSQLLIIAAAFQSQSLF
jgi:hypothetical protein